MTLSRSSKDKLPKGFFRLGFIPRASNPELRRKLKARIREREEREGSNRDAGEGEDEDEVT